MESFLRVLNFFRPDSGGRIQIFRSGITVSASGRACPNPAPAANGRAERNPPPTAKRTAVHRSRDGGTGWARAGQRAAAPGQSEAFAARGSGKVGRDKLDPSRPERRPNLLATFVIGRNPAAGWTASTPPPHRTWRPKASSGRSGPDQPAVSMSSSVVKQPKLNRMEASRCRMARLKARRTCDGSGMPEAHAAPVAAASWAEARQEYPGHRNRRA